MADFSENSNNDIYNSIIPHFDRVDPYSVKILQAIETHIPKIKKKKIVFLNANNGSLVIEAKNNSYNQIYCHTQLVSHFLTIKSIADTRKVRIDTFKNILSSHTRHNNSARKTIQRYMKLFVADSILFIAELKMKSKTDVEDFFLTKVALSLLTETPNHRLSKKVTRQHKIALDNYYELDTMLDRIIYQINCGKFHRGKIKDVFIDDYILKTKEIAPELLVLSLFHQRENLLPYECLEYLVSPKRKLFEREWTVEHCLNIMKEVESKYVVLVLPSTIEFEIETLRNTNYDMIAFHQIDKGSNQGRINVIILKKMGKTYE